MSTNKHTSTDLTTTTTNEAKKAQEWVRGNQSVKIGSKTVAGILGEVKKLVSGTLNLAEKPGKLSNTQTDAIIAKIQEDAFAKKYIEKQLDHENNRTKKNVLEALDMYYEVRAYLGLVSYMSSTLESHGKKCEKAKAAFAAGDTSSIPQRHNLDFQEWKKELEKEKTKLETSFSMLPKVGQDRLNANYTQWLTESDLSSITTGLPPVPTHTPPVAPNILSARHISITSLSHSEKIQGNINAGETLWLTKDGVTWNAVAVDPITHNFNIDVSETTNGRYTYRLKTKNAAGTESAEETVIVDINVITPAVPSITSGANFSVNTPTIEGTTTPNSEVKIYEGTNEIGNGIADASGIFSIRTSALADGTHDIKIEAYNPADRAKKNHENQSINIDTLSQKAETAVVAAETASPKTQKLHDDAKGLVAKLTPSAKKTDLEKRLQTVQDEIDIVAELNKSLNFTKTLEIEQGTDDPEFEVDNAISGEELLFSYPSENPNSVSRTKGRGYKDASFLATGSNCDITLEQLKTDKARTINVFIKRRKNGIEGQEMMVKIKIKPAPTLPEKPDDLVESIDLNGSVKTSIKATLKDPKHTIKVLGKDRRPLSPAIGIIGPDSTTGEFEFDISADELGITHNGEKEKFYIEIGNGIKTKLVAIKTNVTGKKEKIEISEKPEFEIPNHDYVEGELYSFPIKIKNAVKGGYVSVHITDKDGNDVPPTPKNDIQMNRKGGMIINHLGKIKLPKDGQYAVKIIYSEDKIGVSTAPEEEEQFFEAKKAPKPVDLAMPEGIPETIDVTSEPFNISGKLKDKSHGVELLNDAGGSFTPPIKPAVKDDGTFSIQLPKFGIGDHTIKYKIRVSDTSGRTLPMMDITANKKIPPKSNMWIIENEHDFVHKCEHVKKHPSHPEHFFINGKGQFDIEYKKKGMYGLRKDIFVAKNIPNSSGSGGSTKNIEANSPQELYEKIQGHLKSVNTKEKNEYNARWGLAPEPTNESHKKDGEHDKDHGDKDGKKDKEHGDHGKGGHGDHGSESKGGKFIGAVTAVGKTVAWPAAGALAGIGYYSLISGGAVLLGPAIGFGATLGAGAWAIRKLWQIKNGKKSGDSGGHAHH